jgi:hypothetical protein
MANVQCVELPLPQQQQRATSHTHVKLIKKIDFIITIVNKNKMNPQYATSRCIKLFGIKIWVRFKQNTKNEIGRIDTIKANGIVKFVNTKTENSSLQIIEFGFVQRITKIRECFIQQNNEIIFSKKEHARIETTLDTIQIYDEMPPNDAPNECPICLETECNAKLNCQHSFCGKCIIRNINQSTLCPMCRIPIATITRRHRLTCHL